MELKTKFKEGDIVWFPQGRKYFEGQIDKIVSWEWNKGFLYRISHSDEEESLCITDNFYESEIYLSKDKEKIISDMFRYSIFNYNKETF